MGHVIIGGIILGRVMLDNIVLDIETVVGNIIVRHALHGIGNGSALIDLGGSGGDQVDTGNKITIIMNAEQQIGNVSHIHINFRALILEIIQTMINRTGLVVVRLIGNKQPEQLQPLLIIRVI